MVENWKNTALDKSDQSWMHVYYVTVLSWAYKPQFVHWRGYGIAGVFFENSVDAGFAECIAVLLSLAWVSSDRFFVVDNY